MYIIMDESLVRQELPIQSVRDRSDNVSATVPVHLEILNLPHEIRTSPELVADAKKYVSEMYDEDMAYYIDVLKKDGIVLDWLKGYEHFDPYWKLTGEADENGFLKLLWHENNDIHQIKYVNIPVIIQNQHNEFGEFVTPEYCKERGWIEIIYRNLRDPDYVNMPVEKMLKYGKKSDLTKFSLEKGVVELESHAFCSDYHSNMAKALLLRDFAVFYLNNLLRISNSHKNN